MIQCKNLSHAYGNKLVLEGLSFSVEKGGIFGLLGRNGAGKSTFINILMGFLKPSAGTCQILGEASHNLSWQTRSRIGLLHEGFIQYDFMSIAELESYFAAFYPLWDRQIFFDLVNRLHLPHSRRLSRMSCGQRSQVVLGLIMAQKPELMILDDYSMGLDVGYRRLFVEYLKAYVKEFHTTVLLTSHVVQELDALIDHMIVLKKGKVCVAGTKDEFMGAFKCFRFDRTAASLHLAPDLSLSMVEHLDNQTFIYGFLDQNTVTDYLAALNIPVTGLTQVPMGFEDAFVGLTGKY